MSIKSTHNGISTNKSNCVDVLVKFRFYLRRRQMSFVPSMNLFRLKQQFNSFCLPYILLLDLIEFRTYLK